MAFSTKIKGNHHLQGNVQVYNVRIPDPSIPQNKGPNGCPRVLPFVEQVLAHFQHAAEAYGAPSLRLGRNPFGPSSLCIRFLFERFSQDFGAGAASVVC